MGRAARANARKRQDAAANDTNELARFERKSTLAVLSAASASPTIAQRQPSISIATQMVHQRKRNGSVPAVAADLAELLAAGAGKLRYGGLEGEEPLDPRLGVRVRWGRELFRVAPGGWERPVSIIEDAKLLSRALDRTVDARRGFRISDLVELALRYMDATLVLLAPNWPHDAELTPEELVSVSVSSAEVEAAVAGPSISSVASRCNDPVRADRALRWASCKPTALKADPTSESGVFGPVLAVRRAGDHEALPVGFILDGIYSALEKLLVLALGDQGAREAWERLSRQHVLRLLSGRGGPLAPAADAGAGPIVALQPVGDEAFLAVDMACIGLEGFGFSEARGRLSAFMPGATVRTPRGEISIGHNAEIVRAIVVVGPGSVYVFHAEDDLPINVIRAEELRWMITAAERPDDIPIFLLDSQTPAAEHLFSFGTFDTWEVWQANGGAFHRLGAQLTSLLFAPHHERAEWIRHAELSWLEHSLLEVNLPGLSSWPEVNLDRDGAQAATLIDLLNDLAVEIGVRSDGVIVAIGYRLRETDETRASNIARALLWKLRHLVGTIDILAGDEGRAVRIEVVGPVDIPDNTVRVRRTDDVFVVEFDAQLGDELVDDAGGVESRIGQLIAAASGGSTTAQQAFSRDFDAAPPGIAVDATSVPYKAHSMPSFVEPHGSFRAELERVAAQHLMRAGIQPGIRTGVDARDLESRHIYPVLSGLFSEVVAPFDAKALLLDLLGDLESAYLGRYRSEGHQARLASLSREPGNKSHKIVESRRDGTVAVRSLSLAVEEVMRRPPQGERVPGYFDRQRVHAAAYLLFNSGMRSETLHHVVAGTELEITESFELIARATDIDFDWSAYNNSHAIATFPQRSSFTDPNETVEDQEQQRSVVQAMPELAGIDSALFAAIGFGLDALIGVLHVITGWPVDDDRPVVMVERSALIDEVTDRADRPASELEAAVDWLTLRPANLQGEKLEHWELDRRAIRLATRPLVETADGKIAMCPWGGGATLRIVTNHLSDGRLPWPRSALPDAVNQSLEAYRRKRNAALEREVVASLNARPGIVAIGPVKKAKVLGLKILPRELDGVCVDENRSRIWVIETKDRTMAFSPHQLRTAIDEFQEPNGYISKVESNVELIRANAEDVASALKASTPDRAWEVLGLMATRRIEPAAFAGSPRVVFATARTVAETVDRDTVPDHRYAAVQGR